MHTILFPVDFSERARGAAGYVKTLAGLLDAEVTLAHVLPPPHHEAAMLEMGAPMLDELFAARMAAARNHISRFLAADLEGVNVNRLILEGDPARRIVEHAHTKQASLIVMPTHGYGGFRRMILGSVTAKVLHDSDVPVLTGVHLDEPPSGAQPQFRKVIAAVDLGEPAQRVIRWAADFAARAGATLEVLHVAPSIEGHVGEYFDPDWRLEFATLARRDIEAMLREAGVEAPVVVAYGDVAREVAETAKAHGADLLVIGRGAGKGLFGRLHANAYAIIRQSPVPVASV